MQFFYNILQKFSSLEKYSIEIVERVPIHCRIGGENIKYMQTKKQKLGHFLDI